MRRAPVLFLACVLLAGFTGCGAADGVSSGATVSVYVAKPQCAGALRELARANGRAGDVRVRAVCLRGAASENGWNLATIGANARRASEDSTTVGYIAEPSPTPIRFSATILDAAGIAQISGASGSIAMSTLLRAIRQAGDASSLRESVRDELGQAR
ncbi:MAG TPA: hypothetical protein VF176_02945 [Solirubrobacterales bacterium]